MDHPFRPGDVVRYDSPEYHCREHIAVAEERGPTNVLLFDTFWGSGGDRHRLTDTEIATAELVFNVNNYDELDQYNRASKSAWEKYAPADRETITSQHGLQARWFIRKGAVEDWPTQIDNARREVERRQADLQSARNALRWAEQKLDRVIAAAATEATETRA